MSTRLEIQNAVLVELGQNRIQFETENTYVNQLMTNTYQMLVDQVMIQGSWSCLKKRLTPVALTGLDDPQFDFLYQLPTAPSVIKVTEVRTECGSLVTNWEVEGDTLLSNQPVSQIVYIKRELNEAEWDLHLTQTVVAGLKFVVSKALQESASTTQGYQSQYFALLNQNRTADNSQGSSDKIVSSTYTRVRGGGLNDLRVGKID